MVELDPNVDWVAVDALMNQIRSLYPGLSWALDVPELSGVLIKAGTEQWDEGRITAAVQATEWWKTRNDSARAWENLYRTDPASATQQSTSLATQIRQWAGTNGIVITAEEAAYIAGLSLSKGETAAEWQANVVNHFLGERGQQAAPIRDQLNARAADYAVPLADATLAQWEQQLLTGMVDMNTYESYLREQAKSMFPGLSNAIDRGITVRQYTAPYAQIAVQELGINEAEIDWRDPKWSTAIHRIDPKTGDAVSMSQSDWTRELRTNGIYGYDSTSKAQETAAGLGQALLERMGRAA